MIRRAAETRTEIREDMKGGRGKVSIRHCLEKEDLTANVRLCCILTLPPGTSIGSHQHDREEEIFIVNHGSGILDDGETETRVSEGDAMLTGNSESHALRNDGAEDLEITALIICDPE